MMKKITVITGALLVIIFILSGMVLFLLPGKDTLPESSEIINRKPRPEPEKITIKREKPGTEWSPEILKKDRVTAIDYSGKIYAYTASKKDARKEIVSYGKEQRKKYDNLKVREIELQMEKEFGIFAVNLGEMDEETAKDVMRAFSYMYETYPCLKGALTNVTLGNPDSFSDGKIAVTECREFVINGEFTVCPFVVKHEIVLFAPSFLQRETLLKKCRDGADSRYWPKNMEISAIVVHELGHQLLNAYAMKAFGFHDIYYITGENQEAYNLYITDSLSSRQTVPKAVLTKAYHAWEQTHAGEDYESFCRSISEYAAAIQKDGGISYTETFAEAITDVYLNKEHAADASKSIQELFIRGY